MFTSNSTKLNSVPIITYNSNVHFARNVPFSQTRSHLDESMGYYWLLTMYQYIIVLSLCYWYILHFWLLSLFIIIIHAVHLENSCFKFISQNIKLLTAFSCDPVADIEAFVVETERILAKKSLHI